MISIGTVVLGFACITGILWNKRIRKLDFYLVLLQNVSDFFFSGIYSSVYGMLMLFGYYIDFCRNQVMHERARKIIYWADGLGG